MAPKRDWMKPLEGLVKSGLDANRTPSPAEKLGEGTWSELGHLASKLGEGKWS